MGYTPNTITAALRRLRRPLLASAVLGPLTAAGLLPAQAQEAPRTEDGLPIEEIVVTGNNVYRDRSDDINPTLTYGLDFFQRFEPSTVGEMLKRTPGVVFTSDVLEYDAVQLRGLDAAYTEVLINGRPIPGQGADRTFFVDRIPSELVERVEIIRSPSADMSSQGVAGSLNIILKDGAQLEGISTRLGTTYYGDDERFRGTGSVALADAGEGYDYWLGLNVQERRNPKQKLEKYFDDSQLEGFAYEDDTRDGTDSSLNGSVGFDVPNGELRFNGYYVYTDRTEEEYVREYEGSAVDPANSDLVAVAQQEEDIDQTSWGAWTASTRWAWAVASWPCRRPFPTLMKTRRTWNRRRCSRTVSRRVSRPILRTSISRTTTMPRKPVTPCPWGAANSRPGSPTA